jgi:hypothetical protein
MGCPPYENVPIFAQSPGKNKKRLTKGQPTPTLIYEYEPRMTANQGCTNPGCQVVRGLNFVLWRLIFV